MRALILLLSLTLLELGFSQADGDVPWVGEAGHAETTREIMARQAAWEAAPTARRPLRRRGRFSDRQNLPQNPLSPPAPETITPSKGSLDAMLGPGIIPKSPQTVSLNFSAAVQADTGESFPPDSMGVAGPAQFLMVINGRIRSFEKATGVMGSLNADLDVFFASTRGSDFSGDPRVRYDRLAKRWIVGCFADAATNNKLLLAVSNNEFITGATVWTHFSFQHNTVSPAGDAGTFADYPTMGVDANAIYMGVSLFSTSDVLLGSTAFVIRKSSVLGAGPIVVKAFRNLVVAGNGSTVQQGVDNYDPAATEGYFIGVDGALFGRLMLRRVSDPGGNPTISGNIPITVPMTAAPLSVPHKGNNDTVDGLLDPIDDRLMAAHLRNGHLWTSHAIGVTNTGASTGTITRNGARWYDITSLSTTPVVTQSGTVFSSSASNTTTERHYLVPSIMVSGQGHAAMGFSTSGSNEFINAATVGRLATDAPGTMQTPLLYTASATAYNPPGDDGSGFGTRRWGDYSMTSLDPSDDMTMWTIQQYCNATNTYGLRVVRLLAPTPAVPSSCSPAAVAPGITNTNVVVTGTSAAGTGFFDPGAGFTNRLTASVSGTGVTVNSVAYTDPTHVTLNLTVAANATLGARSVTVTNPDGQLATSATAILSIAALTPIETWRQTHFGSTADAGNAANAADPDRDGLNNLLEFATGTLPNAPSLTPGTLQRSGSNLLFTFTRNVNALTSVSYIVEWSDSMAASTWSVSGVVLGAPATIGSVQTITATVPAGSNHKRFVRLRVTIP
jgi:hypothetical protein